jgi:adducin
LRNAFLLSLLLQWVADKDEMPVKPMKVENPNQFAPQGENPKELKEKYKAVSRFLLELFCH